ncbi:MAG: DUF4139 domain-containing protein [Flavobacteriales bacterium]|nr:DUF4139 domain-containing protein [Flavobacteriales bacterium]
MKFSALTITFILSACSAFATSVNPVSVDPEKVTVYLSGANLYYSESVQLSPGNNEFIFEDVSPRLVQSSLQASSRNAVIMDVKYNLKYIEKPQTGTRYDRRILRLLDSISDLNFELKNIANKKDVLNKEKNLLLNSNIMKGLVPRDSLPLLKEAMNFLNERLNQIYDLDLKYDRKNAIYSQELQELKDRLAELKILQQEQIKNYQNASNMKHQIIVNAFSEKTTTARIDFYYFVQNAGWTPRYNLMATSADANLELQYFADVNQSSEIDWKRVRLTLSTSNPNESNQKPTLSTWNIGYFQYLQHSMKSLSNSRIELSKETITTDSYDEEVTEQKKIGLTDYIQVVQNLIRTEYEIKLPYQIKSNGDNHRVVISEKNKSMMLEFAAVPKLSNHAYLMAKVAGWEDMDIIPGEAGLYFDGSYTGKMFLNPQTFNDTLNLNLGKDKNIPVSRKKIKEKFKTQFFANDKIETRSIEIMIKNTKTMPVNFVIEDQIPVVKGSDEIVVELLDGDGAQLNEVTGILTWNCKLKANENKKIVFTYEIRYPKGKAISGI